jgi:hypothetical protein
LFQISMSSKKPNNWRRSQTCHRSQNNRATTWARLQTLRKVFFAKILISDNNWTYFYEAHSYSLRRRRHLHPHAFKKFLQHSVWFLGSLAASPTPAHHRSKHLLHNFFRFFHRLVINFFVIVIVVEIF